MRKYHQEESGLCLTLDFWGLHLLDQRLGSLEAKERVVGGPRGWAWGWGCVTDQVDECRGGNAKIKQVDPRDRSWHQEIGDNIL